MQFRARNKQIYHLRRTNLIARLILPRSISLDVDTNLTISQEVSFTCTWYSGHATEPQLTCITVNAACLHSVATAAGMTGLLSVVFASINILLQELLVEREGASSSGHLAEQNLEVSLPHKEIACSMYSIAFAAMSSTPHLLRFIEYIK